MHNGYETSGGDLEEDAVCLGGRIMGGGSMALLNQILSILYVNTDNSI